MDFDHKFINYNLTKGEAYTKDDDRLVDNVMAYNIPAETTKLDLMEYFKQFGDIVSVVLSNQSNDVSSHQSHKMAVINFYDHRSAAKVLQISNHSINKKQIWVRACYSCQHMLDDPQPSAATNTEITTKETSLLNLNDDCLDLIFRQLEINDRINLALCCIQLKDIFIMRARAEYKTLDVEKLYPLSVSQEEKFFEITGPQIEKLECNVSVYLSKNIIVLLGIHCKNVTSVQIGRQVLTADYLQMLLNNMDMIEELHLIDCSLIDECIPVMGKLNKLKTLCLDGNSFLTGEHIEDLSTVSKLSLHDCVGIRSTAFRKICVNLKNLTYLDISMCGDLKLSDVQYLIKYSHNLENILLGSEIGRVDLIASLPRLKHLYLFVWNNNEFMSALLSQLFSNLAKRQADLLETLAIHSTFPVSPENTCSISKLRNLRKLICSSNTMVDDKFLNTLLHLQGLELLNIAQCKNVSSRGLLHFIQKCPNLSALNVSFCEQLDTEFARHVLKFLESERTQRAHKKPLEITAFESGICPNEVKTTAFESATDLLLILFKEDVIYVNFHSILDLFNIDEYESEEEFN